jgi:hypothetical protein
MSFTRVTFSLSGRERDDEQGSVAPSSTGRGKSVTPASETENCPGSAGAWRSA